MSLLYNYIKYNIKILIAIFVLIVVLIILTIANFIIDKSSLNVDEYIYKNEVSEKVISNDFDDIDYNLIKKDFEDIEKVIIDQIINDSKNNNDIENYNLAVKIYDEKIEELTTILYHKLDIELYDEYLSHLNDFQYDLKSRSENLQNQYESTIDYTLNKNKMIYEEKRDFCKRVIDEYSEYF